MKRFFVKFGIIAQVFLLGFFAVPAVASAGTCTCNATDISLTLLAKGSLALMDATKKDELSKQAADLCSTYKGTFTASDFTCLKPTMTLNAASDTECQGYKDESVIKQKLAIPGAFAAAVNVTGISCVYDAAGSAGTGGSVQPQQYCSVHQCILEDFASCPAGNHFKSEDVCKASQPCENDGGFCTAGTSCSGSTIKTTGDTACYKGYVCCAKKPTGGSGSGSGSNSGGTESGGNTTPAPSANDISDSAGGGTINLINPLAKTVSPDQPIQTLAARLINVMFGISGSVALFMFVLGGFLWLTSAGSEHRVEQGRNIFQWASLGLIVMFSAYVIVQYLFGTLLTDYGGLPDNPETPGITSVNTNDGGDKPTAKSGKKTPAPSKTDPAGGTGSDVPYCCVYHSSKMPVDTTASDDTAASTKCGTKFNADGYYGGQCASGAFCQTQKCAFIDKSTCSSDNAYSKYSACKLGTGVGSGGSSSTKTCCRYFDSNDKVHINSLTQSECKAKSGSQSYSQACSALVVCKDQCNLSTKCDAGEGNDPASTVNLQACLDAKGGSTAKTAPPPPAKSNTYCCYRSDSKNVVTTNQITATSDAEAVEKCKPYPDYWKTKFGNCLP